jgi:hypothetical protein
VFGYPTTFRSRITELEQTENWVDALTEYGSFHFKKPEVTKSRKYIKSGIHTDLDLTSSMAESEAEKDGREGREGREGHVIDMTLDSPLSGQAAVRDRGRVQEEGYGRSRDGGRDATSTGATIKNAPQRRESEEAKQEEEEGEEEEGEGEEGAWSQSAELERGRLRCLLELGHLDAIVDQVGGEVGGGTVVLNEFYMCVGSHYDGMGWDGIGWVVVRCCVVYCVVLCCVGMFIVNSG